MKFKVFTLTAIIIAAVGCAGVESGSVEIEKGIPRGQTRVLSIDLSHEITSADSPLTRAGGDDLYVISVVYVSESAGHKPYAYGVFDDVSDIKLRVAALEDLGPDVNGYLIEASMIPNGKNVLPDNGGAGYLQPFSTRDLAVADPGTDTSSPTPVTNRFIYSATRSTWSSRGVYTAGGLRNIPRLERQYALVPAYVPSGEANESIGLEFIRASFGVKFAATGLYDGNLVVEPAAADPLTLFEESFTLTPQTPQTDENIYSFFNPGTIYSRWATSFRPDYDPAVYGFVGERYAFTFTYLPTDGAPVVLGTETIAFERNRITTVNVDLRQTGSEVKTTLEVEPMTDVDIYVDFE